MELEEIYRQILDETNQLIQISDIENFKMLYANIPARSFTQHALSNYQGEYCYKYMMGLDEQCPFCPMRNIGDQESYITEIDNGQQVFNVKTQKVKYDGKECFIEYATDITMSKRAQQIFISQLQTLLKSIPEAQGIFHLNLTKDEVISTTGVSKNVDKLDFKSVDDLILSSASYIPDVQRREEYIKTFNRKSLIEAYNFGESEVTLETLSYFDDNNIYWVRMKTRLIMNPQTGDLEGVLYGLDISEEKKYQERIELAQYEKEIIIEKSKRDLLTGVFSKQSFVQQANHYLTENRQYPMAVIFLDLDNFKNVNDILGHLTGDRAIVETAEKLQTIFSNKDIISRFGGDEFCILVKNIPQEKLIDKLDFMLKRLQGTYNEDDKSVSITASVGCVYCQNTSKDILELVRDADKELYSAKRNGRNQYSLKIDK